MFACCHKTSELCPLCSGEVYFFKEYRARFYYKCKECKSAFLDKRYYLDYEEEKKDI